MSGSATRTVILRHLRVERTYGGPHVGGDTSSEVIKTADPVAVGTDGHARLVCALESCGQTFDFRLRSVKERFRRVLVRILAATVALAAASFTAQFGTWLYDQGRNSQPLRITADLLVGFGVVASIALWIWTLLSVWSWFGRYELRTAAVDGQPPAKGRAMPYYGGVRSGHSVKLRRAKS
jgi:hypothetical protein